MTKVSMFRKRPVVIEGMRYDGTNAAEIDDWTNGRFREVYVVPARATIAEVYDYLHDTWVGVEQGQWIMRGIKGEFYPMDPEVLAATYDVVEVDE